MKKIMLKKKGVALIWALVLSAILLIISTTMVTYIIQESQFSVRISESTAAYSYASSGIEWANHELENGGGASTNEFDINGDGETDTTVVISTGDCSGGEDTDFCISSTGVSGDVTRKLEHEVTPMVANPIDLYNPPQSVKVSEDNSESFEMSFRFWGSHSSYFGLNQDGDSDNLNNPYLAMRIQIENDGTRHDNVKLEYRDKSGNSNATEPIYDLFIDDESSGDTDGDGIIEYRRNPYEYRATIRYIKDTAASIKICRKIESGGTESFDCLGGASLDLNGKDLGNLNSLFVYDSGASEGTSTEVDYTYREFLPGTEQSWAGDGNIILGRPETCASDDIAICGSNIFWMIYDNVTLSGVKVINGYIPNYTLTVPNPGAMGYIESVTETDNPIKCGAGFEDCSTTFNRGVVELNAVSTDGSQYAFTGWEGDCSGEGSCTISLLDNKENTVSANFTAIWRTYSGIPYKIYYKNLDGQIWAVPVWQNKSCKENPNNVCDTAKITVGIYAFKSNNTTNYNDFPARNQCKTIEGRLPNINELKEIHNLGILGGRYWSSEEYAGDKKKAYDVGNGGDVRYDYKYEGYNIICVKD